MKKFRELYIAVNLNDTEKFGAAVDAVLACGWTRATDAEERASVLERYDHCYYYRCDKRGSRNPAFLAIYRKDERTLYVSNIGPLEAGEFTYQQYNCILQDFHDNVLNKLRTSFPITFMLSSDQLRLEDMMSPEAFKKLKDFSAAANKSTGSSHPQDRRRWFAFLVKLHCEQHDVDSESLLRWFTEVEEWPQEVALDLASEFDFGIRLLGFKPPKSDA